MPPSRWKLWLWRFAVTVSLAMWWGGLTFYAAIVVPLGIEQIGGAEQGLLTQRVTVRLNVAGTIAGICLLADALWRRPRNHRAVMAGVLLGLQVWLWFLHARLSRWLDTASLSPHSGDSFYHEHRIYLWATSAQWLIGLACLWIWCVRPPAISADDPLV
ncbi:MAG: hypothetical protein IAG10_08390 [Planctomycetaceae bacterium]|nr:hypothetical protein [Planctomycetaceae bacterium]